VRIYLYKECLIGGIEAGYPVRIYLYKECLIGGIE
jgi:hypothetical protein